MHRRPTLSKEAEISSDMISTWTHIYLDEGEAGLESEKKS
jgi:hypothetical protein